MPQSNFLIALFWAAGLSMIALIYALSPILPLFLSGAIIAYVAYPALTWLKAHRLSDTWAICSVLLFLLLVVLAVLFIIIPLFVQYMRALPDSLPVLVKSIYPSIHHFLQSVGIDFKLDTAHVKPALTHWAADPDSTVKQLLNDHLSDVSDKGMALINLIASALFFPWIIYYFLQDGGQFVKRCTRLIPRRYVREVINMIIAIDKKLSIFLHGELLIMLIMGLFYSIALTLFGLEHSIPIGLITGVLGFIPYLGLGIGIVLATLGALIQFGVFTHIWPVWIIFFVGYLLETNYIRSKLVSERMNLPPMLEMFAFYAFSQLFGFIGLLLACPLAAILHVSWQHARQHYLASAVYRKPT